MDALFAVVVKVLVALFVVLGVSCRVRSLAMPRLCSSSV